MAVSDILSTVSLSFTVAEISLLHDALGYLQPSEEISNLRARFRGLLSAETSFLGEGGKNVVYSEPDVNPGRAAPCPRNGKALQSDGRWRASSVFSRASSLTSDSVISALTCIHYDSPLDGPATWVESVKDLVSCSNMGLDGTDLLAIIARCQALRKRDVACGFLGMLSSIQLAFKCQE